MNIFNGFFSLLKIPAEKIIAYFKSTKVKHLDTTQWSYVQETNTVETEKTMFSRDLTKKT